MIIPHYYEDPHTLHVGTMPNRAYYIPASRRSDALVEHRETSDRFQLLNGSWKFRYYASIYDLQDAFYEVGYDASAFDSIPVPSVWQNHGYDHHQYTNIRYPFPADPPYVPKENPCGAYLYDFTYQKDAAAPRAFLNFEGVASCFYVWLNGQFVGYSQVAHSTSEFDVTKFLQDGTNHLAVLVLKWCDGSYMEDQDMFRMNGIFRDVYLLHRPEQCIEDYFITTDIHGSTAGVAVRLRYYDSAVATRITLYDAAGTIVGSVTPVEAPDDAAFPYHAEITVVDPTLWNAEQPYLYTLVLDTPNETITDRVGIREVHVANNQIYVNGQSIKFHGVNRHESDPVTGYAVGFEQTKKDLLMIKKHNFNAIRTSHYPDVPYFYQLCDQYGNQNDIYAKYNVIGSKVQLLGGWRNNIDEQSSSTSFYGGIGIAAPHILGLQPYATYVKGSHFAETQAGLNYNIAFGWGLNINYHNYMPEDGDNEHGVGAGVTFHF